MNTTTETVTVVRQRDDVVGELTTVKTAADLTVSFWFGRTRERGVVTEVRVDESGAAFFTVETDTAVFSFVRATSVTVETRTEKQEG